MSERSVNKWMGVGRVGAEPEVRSTPNGTRIAKVSLATSRTWKDGSGQQQDRTEWHRLTFWGKLADVVEKWVHKGDRLYVEGRIEYSQTTDDQGNTKYWTDINVQEMVMLGGNSSAQSDPVGAMAEQARPDPLTDDPDDGLPFK